MDLMDEEVSLKHQVEVRLFCSFVLLICVIQLPLRSQVVINHVQLYSLLSVQSCKIHTVTNFLDSWKTLDD